MGIANKVCDFFEFWYYQYILVTALYMLEFWERAVFSILGVVTGKTTVRRFTISWQWVKSGLRICGSADVVC